jgi:hypothetical protein
MGNERFVNGMAAILLLESSTINSAELDMAIFLSMLNPAFFKI